MKGRFKIFNLNGWGCHSAMTFREQFGDFLPSGVVTFLRDKALGGLARRICLALGKLPAWLNIPQPGPSAAPGVGGWGILFTHQGEHIFFCVETNIVFLVFIVMKIKSGVKMVDSTHAFTFGPSWNPAKTRVKWFFFLKEKSSRTKNTPQTNKQPLPNIQQQQ